ncbi:MAG: hypothetical protein AB1742_00220 [bacterium]
MTRLRVLFNVLETRDVNRFFPLVKSLGIESASVFGSLRWKRLPRYFTAVAREFTDVCVNLLHDPAYRDEPGWREALQADCARIVPALAALGIHDYAWMIEGNLYGYPWNPLVGRYVHRNRLVDRFNAFYDAAHAANPRARVIIVPYPHPLMNLDCGVRGWKDWWTLHGAKAKFDAAALNAHVGVWIPAASRSRARRRLLDSVRFMQDRGFPPLYVEVGYPTAGRKPLVGWYGRGTERDQARLLAACCEALNDAGVPAMQICELMDPDPSGQIYESFFGNEGKLPRFLGAPVVEEAHWGLLRKDGTEKPACDWVRRVTGAESKRRPQ